MPLAIQFWATTPRVNNRRRNTRLIYKESMLFNADIFLNKMLHMNVLMIAHFVCETN